MIFLIKKKKMSITFFRFCFTYLLNIFTEFITNNINYNIGIKNICIYVNVMFMDISFINRLDLDEDQAKRLVHRT